MVSSSESRQMKSVECHSRTRVRKNLYFSCRTAVNLPIPPSIFLFSLLFMIRCNERESSRCTSHFAYYPAVALLSRCRHRRCGKCRQRRINEMTMNRGENDAPVLRFDSRLCSPGAFGSFESNRREELGRIAASLIPPSGNLSHGIYLSRVYALLERELRFYGTLCDSSPSFYRPSRLP